MSDTFPEQINKPDVVDVRGGSPVFWYVKRLFDIVVSLLLFPLVVLSGLVLILLNPWLNSGDLVYYQNRMGQGGRAFRIIKFRSMTAAQSQTRGADDPLELDRITPLGHYIRKLRIDELPQMINVLKGDMSLIGPRPEQYDYAARYAQEIPKYHTRHLVRPGISGLAQVELGYTDSVNAIKSKFKYDMQYVRNAGVGMDMYIFWRTLVIVWTGFGAR